MIRDLSLTLQAILTDPSLATDFPDLAAAQIAFDRPSETFNPATSTVDLFLFDVRENLELRSSESKTVPMPGQFSLQKPPLRVVCTYLVTAWPVGGSELALQEQRLLAQALQVLARYPHIPSSYLRGKLIGQDPPVPIMTAQVDGVREPYEYWSAIGNKMRASILVQPTISLDVFAAITAPEVIASSIRLDRRAAPDREELVPDAAPARFRFGGTVSDATHAPVADAEVSLPAVGLVARTDGDGRYQLGAVSAGTYTLRVQKGAASKDVSVTLPPSAGSRYDVQIG